MTAAAGTRANIDARFLGAAIIAVAAVAFNAVLAILNGKGLPVTPPVVMAAEGFIISAAIFSAACNPVPEMRPWLALIAAIVGISLARAILTEEIALKYARDAAIIPIFVLLGMATGEQRIHRIVLIVHTLVFLVFLLEAIDTDLYAEIFRIPDYYIATRGTRPDDFYDQSSSLFINATRPDERFIPFIDAPRMSSVFLEPVSLGSYCAIIVAYACAAFGVVSRATIVYLALTSTALLVGCDGRLGIVTCLIMVAARPVFARIPSRMSFLILPAVLLAAAIAAGSGNLRTGGDDFEGRVATTMALLAKLDFADLAGIEEQTVKAAFDSGIVYLVATQSVFGALMIWGAITLFPEEKTTAARVITHCLALYMTLTMLVSYSFVSIKTAALAWMIAGALQRPAVSPRKSRAPERARPRRRPVSPTIAPAA